MAAVKITRRLEWFGLMKQLMIEVDGHEVGGVRVRGELLLDLPPGRHTFQALIDWVGSEPLEVEVPETGTTTIGVAAPFERAMAATGKRRPAGDRTQYARRNNGLDIWEYS